jgi:hypothetical protein
VRLGELDTHPAADAFPLMTGAEYDELVADIQANGLRQRIVLHDGMILDGRNRERACRDAGVEPHYTPYIGDDPIGYVLSANFRRRHLNESQRALVAAKLATLPRGRRKQTGKLAGLPTQREAAETLNVGERTVREAGRMLKHAIPDVVSAVEQGELTVAAAAELAKLPRAQQRARLEASLGAPTARGRGALARRDSKPMRRDPSLQLVRTLRRALSELGATIAGVKTARYGAELELVYDGRIWSLELELRSEEQAA